MRAGFPSSGSQVGLVVVDPGRTDVEWLQALVKTGIRATFFVRAEQLVTDYGLWRAAVDNGQELGNGALLGATDDGRLRNWSCRSLEEEIRAVEKLIRELGQDDTSALALPGRHHVCADGDYRPSLERAFQCCLGASERLSSFSGRRRALSFKLGDAGTRPTVLFLHPSVASPEFLIAQARALNAGPLRDLALA